MNNFLDLVKYLVYGMIIYVLFSYVPQNKLPLTDVLVITIVIMMTYMLLDFIAPYNNIENLDPDYIDVDTCSKDTGCFDKKKFNAKPSDTSLSTIGHTDSVGNLDEMIMDNNINLYQIQQFESIRIANILVNSGIPSEEIDELLELCINDKKECNNKLRQMNKNGLLNNTNLDILTNHLIQNKEEKLIQPEEKLIQPEEKLIQPEEKLIQPEEKLIQTEENRLIKEENRLIKEENRLIKEENRLIKSNKLRLASNECKFADKLSCLKDDSEMKYSELDPNMHIPLGKYSNDFTNNFEYGYAYLNTNKWNVPMYKPPSCKTDDNCKVCSSTTTGYPVNVKEWNSSRKIMPPDNINIEYINKLNQGN